MTRTDWTLEALENLYQQPLFQLLSQAHDLHKHHHTLGEIQVCTLISIKTGGCPEDCKYCAQSSRYQTSISAQPMLSYTSVMQQAQQAKDRGATRICLGAAWREVRDSKQFEEVLSMVHGISTLGVEVCCTLGMLKEEQAIKLKAAGLYAYNHNLDTSENFYKTIITTRTYQDRLNTLDIVEQAQLSVCCGGILGLGESITDRLQLLLTLCQRNPHPESVPINCLTPIPGTPLEHQGHLPFWELLRMVAVARIALPSTMIRLSAGRLQLSYEHQALCFLAGANSIFAGDKLLTVSNHPVDSDEKMFEILGLKKRPAFAKESL